MSREPPTDAELLTALLDLPDAEWPRVLRCLSTPQLRSLRRRWWLWAHPGQLAPAGEWRVWLIRAGRGFGKTRAGAEWVWQVARAMPGAQIALVGATVEDAIKVMVRGRSGLLNTAREDEPVSYLANDGVVKLGAGGAVAHIYSAAAAEKLRGPEHAAAWCDELAKWRHGEAAWDNLMLGLRVGERPRCLVTTTPRPNALMHRVLALPGLVESRGSSRDNPHLPPAWLAGMEELYGGTRLARQELEGELVDDLDGALFLRGWFEAGRMVPGALDTAALVRVVVGVDPPASTTGDACGIVACARDGDGIGYVLEDASVAGLSPEGWAQAVAECAARWRADRVVAEKNNGGDMVRSVLAAADTRLPITLVHASHGKSTRAEPIAAMYERGRVRHVGGFAALEDELAGMLVAGGYAGPGGSPDRADACVWALTELLLGTRGRARVRGLAG